MGFAQKKDVNTSWLVLQNCLLNVETLDCIAKRRAGEPEWENYPKLNVRLDLSAKRDRWLKFLDETVQDPDEIEMLQEFCGYCLLGDNRFKKALYIYGPPASGKGVFEDTMANVFGRENVIRSFHGLDLEDRYALIGLFDKTICFLCERRVVSKPIFKSIAAGEQIAADRKHRDPIYFNPACKLCISINVPPPENPADLRWIVPIHFKKSFRDNEMNHNLSDQLANEKDGIFAWALGGLRRLLKNGGFGRGVPENE